MSQSLMKLKQVWLYLSAHGPLSAFGMLIDKCVKMAYHEVRGEWVLKQKDVTFYKRMLNQMREPLHEAYIKYHAADTRELPYPEYEEFMSAVRSCALTINDKTLQNLEVEPKRLHDSLPSTAPRPPVPSATPAPSGTPGTPGTSAAPAPFPTPETRLAELLARLRDILDEFTRKPRTTEAAPAEDTLPGSEAEDYYSDGT
jgi:hypothetical protein